MYLSLDGGQKYCWGLSWIAPTLADPPPSGTYLPYLRYLRRGRAPNWDVDQATERLTGGNDAAFS